MGIAVLIAGAFVVSRPPLAGQLAPEPMAVMSADRAAAYIDAAAQGLDYLPGEVVVKFREGVAPDEQQRALDSVRSRPSVDALEWAGEVAILRDPSQPDARVLAEQLSAQPEVLYAEPNYLRHKDLTPNDTGYGPRQWNLQALDMPKAWDINPGANDTLIVAIVDTGVTTTNTTRTVATWNGSAIQTITRRPTRSIPTWPASRLVSPMDFVTNMGTTVLDSDGHGTHVSSTVGEDTNNALLNAGIAYNARIMPVKVCTSYWDIQFAFSGSGGRGFVPSTSGGCPTTAIASGIRYAADNGAKVINLSLGGSSPSTTEQDAINTPSGKAPSSRWPAATRSWRAIPSTTPRRTRRPSRARSRSAPRTGPATARPIRTPGPTSRSRPPAATRATATRAGAASSGSRRSVRR